MKSNSDSSASVELCPFDGLPCKYVSSCDDVIHFALGEFRSCQGEAERSDVKRLREKRGCLCFILAHAI